MPFLRRRCTELRSQQQQRAWSTILPTYLGTQGKPRPKTSKRTDQLQAKFSGKLSGKFYTLHTYNCSSSTSTPILYGLTKEKNTVRHNPGNNDPDPSHRHTRSGRLSRRRSVRVRCSRPATACARRRRARGATSRTGRRPVGRYSSRGVVRVRRVNAAVLHNRVDVRRGVANVRGNVAVGETSTVGPGVDIGLKFERPKELFDAVLALLRC